jgi:hypothetical protein
LLVDDGQYLLFDLPSDPGERTDLAVQRPDIVFQLKGLLAGWQRDVDGASRGR